jgi:hypothetical protein
MQRHGKRKVAVSLEITNIEWRKKGRSVWISFLAQHRCRDSPLLKGIHVRHLLCQSISLQRRMEKSETKLSLLSNFAESLLLSAKQVLAWDNLCFE